MGNNTPEYYRQKEEAQGILNKQRKQRRRERELKQQKDNKRRREKAKATINKNTKKEILNTNDTSAIISKMNNKIQQFHLLINNIKKNNHISNKEKRRLIKAKLLTINKIRDQINKLKKLQAERNRRRPKSQQVKKVSQPNQRVRYNNMYPENNNNRQDDLRQLKQDISKRFNALLDKYRWLQNTNRLSLIEIKDRLVGIRNELNRMYSYALKKGLRGNTLNKITAFKRVVNLVIQARTSSFHYVERKDRLRELDNAIRAKLAEEARKLAKETKYPKVAGALLDYLFYN